MRTIRRRLLLASLALAACSPPAAPPEDTRDAAGEHAEVRTLLYEQGLIEDPEVQARMSAFVLRMRRDGLAPERGYREFRQWLEAWVRANPDRARAARARRGPARDGPGVTRARSSALWE